jgi:BirA family transcriptional regulator, biotin operon repressor / biotin---[acetyl-CoA-carboxylase] ligase
VEILDRAESTNALVADRARAGEPEWLVVVAEHQTAGRGRLDRTWETPDRAALTFSVLLRPEPSADRWPWLPLLTGYAVGWALRDAGADACLKWPNDVTIGDGKVAGILLERIETAAGPAAVLGIGINVSTTRAELPVDTATSLAIEGVGVDRTDLLSGVLGALSEKYDEWQGSEGASLAADYQRVCTTIGRDVRVDLPGGGSLTGLASGIDDDGRLLVEADGAIVPVGAGDVVHVRSAG